MREAKNPARKKKGQKTAFNILIADDSIILRKRLIALLSENNWKGRIFESRDVPTTLAALKKHHPRVIILDLNMPGGGGYKALKQIKSAEQSPVVIVFTNYPNPIYRQRCRAVGAEYFLDKSSEFRLIPGLLAGIYKNTIVKLAALKG